MKKKSLLFTICTAVMMLCMLFPLAAFAEGEEVSKMAGTWWSLVPPVIAIALALITKEVYSSLFVGIVVGGMFAANFSPIKTVDNILNEGIIVYIPGLSWFV